MIIVWIFLIPGIMALCGFLHWVTLQRHKQSVTIPVRVGDNITYVELATSIGTVNIRIGLPIPVPHKQSLFHQLRNTFAEELDWDIVTDLVQRDQRGKYEIGAYRNVVIGRHTHIDGGGHPHYYITITFDTKRGLKNDFLQLPYMFKAWDIKQINLANPTPVAQPHVPSLIANSHIYKIVDSYNWRYAQVHPSDKEMKEVCASIGCFVELIQKTIPHIESDPAYLGQDKLRQVFTTYPKHVNHSLEVYYDLKSKHVKTNNLANEIIQTMTQINQILQEFLNGLNDNNTHAATKRLELVRTMINSNKST